VKSIVQQVLHVYFSLHIPTSSATDSFIQCVSLDGQIGFVYNKDVEPLHVISISSTTNSESSTMNQIFHRKTGKLEFFE
jgi:hypothetical protein